MTKSEAIALLKQSTFRGLFREAIDTVVEAAESVIPYRSKWVFDSQISCGYYHDGCKAKSTLHSGGAVYTYFGHQYRFCPNCGEPMYVREEE